MPTVRQHPAKLKPLSIEELASNTGYPLRKGGTSYLKWLLMRDDLHSTLREAIHAELTRRGVKL